MGKIIIWIICLVLIPFVIKGLPSPEIELGVVAGLLILTYLLTKLIFPKKDNEIIK
jgi:hypothetical protein